MRLGSSTVPSEEEEIKNFADWILAIGNGETGPDENGQYDIDIPQDLLIQDCSDPLMSLVNFTYPDILSNMKNPSFFQDRGILAPTLESVEHVNDYLMSIIPGTEKEYLSFDSACQLKLKVGCPVMLMRNIDQVAGLCNGTRLIVTDLGKRFIGGTVITGKNAGDKIFVARMNLVPSDPGLPFQLDVAIYLPKPVFTHGQLYVALSRVKSRKGLKLLILNEEGEVCTTTTNVVYREVFDNV
ncbi:hypothetical protein TSUD_145570 [Trifolium subterraneum]|uniref:DNA helicase Pif1-like 2B domain-containing protein n=1 Tax=Trifolium subterraneum TaxID=3900 RepID=A0A2Z6MSH3_TRISU|nr:hypothetical protein TSUD_145570 [Trifolium subterraneum]